MVYKKYGRSDVLSDYRNNLTLQSTQPTVLQRPIPNFAEVQSNNEKEATPLSFQVCVLI